LPPWSKQFARQQEVPVVTFAKGQRKDDVAAAYHQKFAGQEGVLFIGKAQEKTPVFRTERRRNEQTGATYPWLVRTTAMVNHFYLPGPGFWALLSEVLHLLPPKRQALSERPRLCKTTTGKARLRL
jgi:hypothetical protein